MNTSASPDKAPASKAQASQEPLVDVRKLGKAYPRVSRRGDRLRALWGLLTGGAEADRIPVLEDVDLQVRRGESLAVIGENGAGKSTLLKLITGVLTPTTGSAEVRGRVGALLELGAGFHPEYSGRENVAMAAALYGLSADETRARMRQILEFADIGAYIEEPVKHYSSGMVVRLGFAVVAAVRPDLLITDEVLAVGDESFQKKCVRWMEDYLDDGGTLLLVSHSMYHAQKLCRRACWLREGRVQMLGDVFEVTQAYLAYHERKQSGERDNSGPRRATGEFGIASAHVNGVDLGGAQVTVQQGEGIRVLAELSSRDGRAPVCMVGLVRGDGTPVYGVSTDMDGIELAADEKGRYRVEVEFPRLALLPGHYTVKVHVMDTEAVRLFDSIENALVIRGSSREFGMVRLPHHWRQPEHS